MSFMMKLFPDTARKQLQKQAIQAGHSASTARRLANEAVSMAESGEGISRDFADLYVANGGDPVKAGRDEDAIFPDRYEKRK